MSVTQWLNSLKNTKPKPQKNLKSLKIRLLSSLLKTFAVPFYLGAVLLAGTGILNHLAHNLLERNTEFLGSIMLLIVGLVITYINRKLFSNTEFTEGDEFLSNSASKFYWKKAWSEKKIPDSSKSTVIILGICAISWNILSWGTYIWVYTQDFQYTSKASSIAFILPLTAIILGAIAFYYYLRYRLYKISYFIPAALPFFLGETLIGNILLGKPLETDQDILIRLRCIEAKHSSAGVYRTKQEKVLWEGKQILNGTAVQQSANPLEIPVSIYVPETMKPTFQASCIKTIYWKLMVSAKVPGKIAYKASFEIPVNRLDDTV